MASEPLRVDRAEADLLHERDGADAVGKAMRPVVERVKKRLHRKKATHRV